MINSLFCALLLGWAGPGSFAMRDTPPPSKDYVFRILPDSHILINGSSNINRFSCRVSRPAESTPLRIAILPDYSVQMDGSITVSVGEFDCKHRMLTSDLRKTLKEDRYKQMTVHFRSLDQIPFDSETPHAVNGTVLIELAGKQKEFQIPIVFTQLAGGQYEMKGTRDFSFEDFGLEAPRKIGGIIRVKNKFTTVFVLNLASP